MKGTTLFHPYRDKTHVDWVKAYLSIWTELQNYIKQHHTTGLTWSKSVSPQSITLKNLRNKSLRVGSKKPISVVMTRMLRSFYHCQRPNWYPEGRRRCIGSKKKKEGWNSMMWKPKLKLVDELHQRRGGLLPHRQMH